MPGYQSFSHSPYVIVNRNARACHDSNTSKKIAQYLRGAQQLAQMFPKIKKQTPSSVLTGNSRSAKKPPRESSLFRHS